MSRRWDTALEVAYIADSARLRMRPVVCLNYNSLLLCLYLWCLVILNRDFRASLLIRFQTSIVC